jgi:hypothetical protein
VAFFAGTFAAFFVLLAGAFAGALAAFAGFSGAPRGRVESGGVTVAS